MHHHTRSKSGRLLPLTSLMALAFATAIQITAQVPDVRQGIYQGRPVTFEVKDGRAIVEGDIILGAPEELVAESRHSLSLPPSADRMWPNVGGVFQVPYTNTDPGTQAPNKAVDEAVRRFNAAFGNVIQFVPRTQEPDFVQFQAQENGALGCSSASNVGRAGGAQVIGGGGGFDFCVGVMMHEMGHAIGLYHEHQRSDRDGFVQIRYSNLDPTQRSNYDFQLAAPDLGLYDMSSTMHYNATTFAVDPTDAVMVSTPVGVPFREGTPYSAGDLDAILRLYGVAPVAVTITSDPVGLQLSVDGQVVTTGTPGATFNWTLGSTHTLDVPANLLTQTLNGYTYVFGRWNDLAPDQPAGHSITINPGDGSALYPSSSPRFTVYEANFQQLIPASGSIVTGASPAQSGSVSLSPDPLVNLNGAPLTAPSYYVMQPLSAQATPAAGFSFYDWQVDGVAARAGGANPLTVRPGLQFYVDTGTPAPRNVTARFASNPVTTIATATIPATSDPMGPALPFLADGLQFIGPKNFALDYDTAWTPGSSHTIAVTSPLPSNVADKDARLVFRGWSDGGAMSHSITSGSANQTLTATFQYQYAAQVSVPGVQSTAGLPCNAGSVTTSPASTDSFYDAGTPVSLTAQPAPGWLFAGWGGDLAGNAAQASLTMDKTRKIQAFFNTASDPLKIGSLAPSTVAVNSPGMNITIAGSGFTSATLYCFLPVSGGASLGCGLVGYVNSNQVTVPVPAALLQTPQSLNVSLLNTPDLQCLATASAPFTVK
jgi:Astacin (Peptidase family M12A)/Divergent InlB B-repeat domain